MQIFSGPLINKTSASKKPERFKLNIFQEPQSRRIPEAPGFSNSLQGRDVSTCGMPRTSSRGEPPPPVLDPQMMAGENERLHNKIEKKNKFNSSVRSNSCSSCSGSRIEQLFGCPSRTFIDTSFAADLRVIVLLERCRPFFWADSDFPSWKNSEYIQ